MSQYQKKHSPFTPIMIISNPLSASSICLQSIAYYLFDFVLEKLTVVLHNQVVFGLPLGLEPSSSYSIHFFTQSYLHFTTRPHHCNLFCCSTEIMSSIPSLSHLFTCNSYRPRLTSIQHTTSHTTAVQSPSHNL